MAITLDAITASNTTTPSDPQTFSHTCAASASIIIVLLAQRNTNIAVGMTYNGLALTKVRADGPNTAAVSEIWYRLAPSSGANTVSIDTNGASTTLAALAVSLIGTDTTAGVIDNHNGTNGTGNLSVDLTSVASGCWFLDVMCGRGNPATITQGAESGRNNWSPDWEYEPGGNEMAGGGTNYQDISPAATKTFSWTTSGVTGSALSVVSIRPPAAAAVVFGKRLSVLQAINRGATY